MRLVVDANILVAELIRVRGRKLIVRPELKLYMAEGAWDEATYELDKRIKIITRKGVFSQSVGQNLLNDAVALAEAKVSIVPHEVYATYETVARNRIPRDPNDWFNCDREYCWFILVRLFSIVAVREEQIATRKSICSRLLTLRK